MHALFAGCVRLNRLLVGFWTHWKSMHIHSFIHSLPTFHILFFCVVMCTVICLSFCLKVASFVGLLPILTACHTIFCCLLVIALANTDWLTDFHNLSLTFLVLALIPDYSVWWLTHKCLRTCQRLLRSSANQESNCDLSIVNPMLFHCTSSNQMFNMNTQSAEQTTSN